MDLKGIAQVFKSEGVTLLDGGFSNELNKLVSFDVHKEPLWTAKALVANPDAVVATHLEYLRAGADMIETGSYQATLEGFKKHMDIDADEAKGYIKKSVELAVLARRKFLQEIEGEGSGRNPKIAGSVGPYGVWLCDGSEYTGSYITSNSVTREDIEKMHLPRIASLVEGGVDILAIETMPSLQEVEIILDLLKSNFPATKAWVSFSVKEKDATKTAAGDCIKTALAKVGQYSQVEAVGINCCAPTDVETFLNLGAEVCRDNHLKMIVYPNSGQEWKREQGWINSPVPLLDTYVKRWASLGAKVIGGCCQVGTDQIRKLRVLVDEINNGTFAKG